VPGHPGQVGAHRRGSPFRRRAAGGPSRSPHGPVGTRRGRPPGAAPLEISPNPPVPGPLHLRVQPDEERAAVAAMNRPVQRGVPDLELVVGPQPAPRRAGSAASRRSRAPWPTPRPGTWPWVRTAAGPPSRRPARSRRTRSARQRRPELPPRLRPNPEREPRRPGDSRPTQERAPAHLAGYPVLGLQHGHRVPDGGAETRGPRQAGARSQPRAVARAVPLGLREDERRQRRRCVTEPVGTVIELVRRPSPRPI